MTRTPVRRPGQPHPWPTLTVSEHGAAVEDRPLYMPRAQHAMLWALATHNGRIITWLELHHAIWPAEHWISNTALYSHLSRLRSDLQLDLDIHHPQLTVPIRTVYVVGLELRWPPERLLLQHATRSPAP